MKKIIISIIIILGAIAIYTSTQAIMKSRDYKDYSFSYTGTAYQGQNILFDYYASGSKDSMKNIIVDHTIIFSTLSKPSLSLHIQTKQKLNDIIMNIKNSELLATGGNYRIYSFNDKVIQNHLNEDISLNLLTGIDYTIDTTEGLLSKYITLQGEFLNQYNQINKIYSTMKIKCGLGAYLFKEYVCTIDTTIDFDLPITAKFDTIILSGKMKISQRGN